MENYDSSGDRKKLLKRETTTVSVLRTGYPQLDLHIKSPVHESCSGMIPYEVWSGKKPNIGHIRVFGSLAHMKLPFVRTIKLDD